MQAVERPARRRVGVRQGPLARPHGLAVGEHWRHVHFVELARAPSSTRSDDGPRGVARGRDGPLAVRLRRLQALHERRLPGRLPDRRADPHGVRDRDRAVRHLQRLRLLRPGVPVRGHRPRPLRRARRQVHALLRPAAGRHGARVREGVPDRLDPVRRATTSSWSARSGASPSCTSAAWRARTCTARATRAQQLAGGLGAFFLLTEPPERFGLPAQADSPIQADVPSPRRRAGRGRGAAARRRRPCWSRTGGRGGEPQATARAAIRERERG